MGQPVMRGLRADRLVRAVLRCYPARWRRRHGDEAAELAALLIRDGKPAGSIALSYFLGAARERLTLRPGLRLGTAMCALVVACSLGVSLGMLASTVPARAASTTQASAHAHCRPAPTATVLQPSGRKDAPRRSLGRKDALRHPSGHTDALGQKPARDNPQPKTREAGESQDGRSC
jgi:hypothetical protein